MGAIDVGNVMGAQVGAGVGLERQGDHSRAEVGTANADIDDVGEAFTACPLDRSVADRSGESAHA